jgi:hypothetical protein
MKNMLVPLTKTRLQTARLVPPIVCLPLLALLALVAPHASATIAVVDTLPLSQQQNSASFGNPFLTTGGDVLVVSLNCRPPTSELPVGPTSLSWVTGSGTVTQALTLAVSKFSGPSGANNKGHQVWYLWNPIHDGSGTIRADYGIKVQRRQVLSAYTLSGVDTNVTPIIAFSATNTSTATPTTTNALGAVPLGGFAVLNSTTTGTATSSPGVVADFSAKPAGSGATVSTSLVTGTVNYEASTWVQGYIPALVPTVTNFSITYSGSAQSVLVGTIFAPSASASTIPELIAPSATAITNTSAALGAIVVTNGGSAITNYGVVYAETGLNPDPQVGGSSVIQLVKGTTDAVGVFTTNATGLTPATQYSYRGYAESLNGIGYSPVGTFYSLANEPAVQATAVTISNVQRSYFTLNWTRGNGDNCIVLVKAGSAVNALPVDGTTYTPAGAAWNSGSQIGVGNYVAYLGADNTVTLAGLTVGTTYHVAVFEVNGAFGPENYLTTSPAVTNSMPVVANTYYSFGNNDPSSVYAWTTASDGSGNYPANFTGGDVFVVQNGSTYAAGGPWTLSGGARLVINSGGTLDMQASSLNLGGSFVNNGEFLNSFASTPPAVTFTASGTITLATNYNASVLAVGGGGGGGGANSPVGTGGGGGGGASAYSTNLVLLVSNAYQVTVGAGGANGTGGGSSGSVANNGSAGGASQFGGALLATIVGNGGGGGQAWSTNGSRLGVGGAGGVAGSTGNAINYAGGDAFVASISGGGGGSGADDAAVGSSTDTGSGGAAGTGLVAQGGAGGSITSGNGAAGSAPGGGGAGGNYSGTGNGVSGGNGGAGRVYVVFNGTAAPAPATLPDYRSRSSGDWSDFNTWSVNHGSGFVNAVSGETPNSGYGHNSVTTMSSHTVTVSSSATTANLKVNTGGILTVSGPGGQLTVNRLVGQTLANNLTVEGTMNLTKANALALGANSTNLIASGGVLNHTGAATVVNNTTAAQLTINGTYVQNITGQGVIPVATWGAASTCRIDSTFTANIAVGTGSSQLNYGQTFGNFVWNAQGNTTNGVYFMSNGAITNWTLQGTLTIENTGSTPSRFEFMNNTLVDVTAKGLFMTGGRMRAGGSGLRMTIDGPIVLSAGELETSGLGASITALGDVIFTNTIQVFGGATLFSFAKAGAQAWTVTATTNADLTIPVWTVNSGSAVTLGSASTCIVDDLTVNGSLTISGNSTLLVNGGANPSTNNAGTITVASGSTLGGDGAIGASITLAAGARMTNNSPGGQLTVTNSLTLNGNTIYVSTGTNVLAPGNYVLITNTVGGISGSFANMVISGAGLAPNTTGNLVQTASEVTLRVVSTIVTPPVITSTVLDGSNLIISGTNATGTAGGFYYVRATNNVGAPIADWPRISTNAYGVGGAFSVTNTVFPGVPVNFYRIEQ